MSTMLKTAAMGLLSKTLQSFLHKYLLEVDVEGVAMPSLIDVDGHSGWGVRLCNVKLREGAELMTLPGKRKVKKKKKRTEDIPKSDSECKPNVLPPARSGRLKEVPDKDAPEQDRYEPNDKRHPEEELNGSNADIKNLASNLSPGRSRAMTEDDTDIESAVPSRASSPSIMCKTSVAGAISGCLSRTTHSYNDVDTDDDGSYSAAPVPDKPLVTKVDDNLMQHDVLFDVKTVQTNHKTESEKAFYQSEQEEFEQREAQNASQYSTNDNPEMCNDQEEEDEEYKEEDMVLRLGKSGQIGTLDIRLVGKELHVMVEDAFLTVEICPKPDEPDDESVRTTSTADSTKDDASSRAKKKKPTTAKEPQTTGEHVLENNSLARALSACPHLLLRDVRLQIILRNKVEETDGEFPKEAGPDDSVVELGIELFSVTSGEDFLANFCNDEDNGMDDSSERSRNKVSLKKLEEADENEYLWRRIRTGKGPDGGISVKVYSPPKKINIPGPINQEWAFQSYTSKSQFTIFRCSGLDIIARIFLGKQKEVALKRNDYAWYGDEYDEYTIDSMLYGIDYIAPAPPPLPPIEKREEAKVASNRSKSEVEVFVTDENGIQSNKIRSCFHRVARGLNPILCKKDHLPSEHCPYCWRDSSRPNSYTEHPFDNKTPLPGLVLSVSFNEPIELNVDRQSLEVIGSLRELFVKNTEEGEKNCAEVEDTVSSEPEKTSIAQKLKNMTKFRKKGKKESVRSAFPSYMKPETTQILGVFVSRAILRIHAMRSDDDLGLSFRYWEAVLRCTTIDIQKHNSKEKQFQDIRGDLGFFESHDYYGVEKKAMVSLGIQQPIVDDTDSTQVENTHKNIEKKEKACWPTTAAVLLQVPRNAEASEYESRERHGLQLRYFSLQDSDSDFPVATLRAKIGVVAVHLESSFPQEVISTISETKASLFGPQGNIAEVDNSSPKKVKDKAKSLLAYSLRLDGGHLHWSPLAHVRFPILKIGGDLSSELFLETILNHVKIEIGKRPKIQNQEGEWSLSRFASLPVDTRMRILLFLNDLAPLENALGVKRESSSFLRCHAVNKAIAKVGNQSRASKNFRKKKSSKVASTATPSRQDMINELMKLDNRTLEEIW
eukprot:CAMPEP_0194263894 /NCGR_PEP_ID=MMETSP0158-20130606/47302_1 /TAXON_ID=33649 /ORGANISM="Thalassionema nitzschioides, Strain L26-B" /LENGTH=1115 /DNA_ID=CAMNT_0039004115 /DNA_START=191 /DNA_END=3535 /DNA_ORIENTATION=-